MHRITIWLPDELAAEAADRADREETSASEIVPRAIAAAFALGDKPTGLPFAARGHSEERTTTQDAEEILNREWAGDRGLRQWGLPLVIPELVDTAIREPRAVPVSPPAPPTTGSSRRR